MASKQVTRNLIEDSRRVSFFVADPASPYAGQLMAHVHLDTDGGPGDNEVATLIVTGAGNNAGLTAQERSDLVAALLKVYNAGKAAAGFV
jgi:hypothetical protein